MEYPTFGQWTLEFDETGLLARIFTSRKTRILLGLPDDAVCITPEQFWVGKLHPDDIERVTKVTFAGSEARVDAPDLDVIYRMMTDRGYRWFHAYCDIQRNEKGFPVSGSGILMDIDEHVRGKELLEEQLDSVYAMNGAARWQVDYDRLTGKRTFSVSNGFWTLLKYRPDDDNDNSLEGFRYAVLPEDVDALTKSYFEFEMNDDPERSYDHTFRVLDRNGEVVWGHSIARKILDENGRIIQVIGLFTDVTEVKKVEQQTGLIEALSHEYQTLWYIRESDRVMNFVSNETDSQTAAQIILDMRDASYQAAVEAYVEKYVVPEDRDRCLREMDFDYVLEKTMYGASHQVNYARCAFNGMVHYYQAIYVRTDDDRSVVALGFRNIDKTVREEQRKQMMLQITAAELKKAKEEAETANNAKTNFLFNMSHDIRTPMNAVLGFNEMALQNIGNDEKVRDCIGKVKISGEYMLSILNDILEMARIESGRLEINEEPMDLSEHGQRIYAMTMEPAQKKGINFRIAPSGVVHNTVYGDRLHLDQISMNILSNAIKYTPPGGTVDCIVSELPCEREGYGLFRVTVKDTGIGMKKEFLEHIFDMFERERNDMTIGQQGTGLGMSITKRLVDAMNGTIEIESEPGKGTTVTVTTPLRFADPAEIARKQESEEFTLAGKHILLAEDNELNAEIACSILESAEMTVDVATDGQFAVEAVANHPEGTYDCILMDVQMPRMDGYTATKTIRAMEDKGKSEIPIIAMTANAFAEDRKHALEIGMDAHIAKPIDIKKLHEALSEVLQRSR
ncbi:MAG: response regulator [Lachnospiraceae bacterium]|nr:response regulator [Lachnospiraceae bacterium]